MTRKGLVILVMLLILGATLRIAMFYFNSYNMDLHCDEPWSKINLAITWIYSGGYMPDSNFGPLHTYIISTLWFLNREDFIVLSRLLSLAFGILFIAVYFYLLKELFSEKVAYFGTFLLAIYPLHIHLSAVSLAEVLAYFLLFSSLFFLIRFIRKQNIFYLIFSSIALNLSCMLRYECWIFVFFFTIILFLKSRSLFHTLVFLLLSCIFPFIWMWLTYIHSGNPISFVATSSRVSRMQMEGVNFVDRLFGFPYTLYSNLTLPISILSGLGLILSFLKKEKRNILAYLFVIILFIFIYRSIQGTFIYGIPRYTLILGLLFIPSGGMAAEYIFNLGRRFKLFYCILFIALLTCVFSSMNALKLFYRFTRVPETLTSLVSWIDSNVGDDDKILLEPGISSPFIVINSHLGSHQVVEFDYLLLFDGKTKFKKLYMEDCTYISVFKHHGEFRYLAPEFVNRIKVFENDDWTIFKFEK